VKLRSKETTPPPCRQHPSTGGEFGFFGSLIFPSGVGTENNSPPVEEQEIIPLRWRGVA